MGQWQEGRRCIGGDNKGNARLIMVMTGNVNGSDGVDEALVYPHE